MPQMDTSPIYGSRCSFEHIDAEGDAQDTSPSSLATGTDISPSSYSMASFGECSPMECDEIPEAMPELQVRVVRLSGQLLCDLRICPTTLVIGLKIKLQRALEV